MDTKFGRLRGALASWTLAVLSVSALTALSSGCSKMDAQACGKLRESAFEIVNQAHQCSTDADCKASEWPGCTKPISASAVDKIHPMMETYTKGKCEEPKSNCKPAPPIFCQEGLCAFRYKPFQGPNDGMKVE